MKLLCLPSRNLQNLLLNFKHSSMNFFYKFSLLLLFVLSVTYLSAQKNVTELVESKRKDLDQLPALGLLKAASVTPNSIDLKDIKNYQLFSIDKQALANRGQAKKDLLKLDLPFKNRKLWNVIKSY